MADGVDITQGTGTTVVTDDCGASGHAQVVKLAISTDGSATLIPADATNGILVNLGSNNDVTNAGTFVVQVDGSALTSLQLIDDTIVAQDASASSAKVNMAGAVRDDALGGLTPAEGDAVPLYVDANGALWVTVSGTVTVASHAVTNAGTFAVQAAQSGTWTVDLGATDNAVLDSGVALLTTIDADTSSIATLAGTIDADTSSLAGCVGGSELQVDVVGSLPAGTNAIGKLAANSGVDIGDVDVTSIAAGTNVIGDVGIAPRTSGGLSVYRTLDLDESEEEVKGSAGQLYKLRISNNSTSPRYVKVYDNTAAGTTVGSTTPIDTIVVPGATSASQPTVITENYGGLGIACSTGITIAATTALADADTGAPSANDVVVTALYK